MLWTWIDVALAVLALLALGGTALALWRHVRALMRAAKDAGARVGAATTALEAVQRRDA